MHRRVLSVVQNLKCSRRRNVVKSSLATGLVTSKYFLEDLIVALYEWEMVYCVRVRSAFNKIGQSFVFIVRWWKDCSGNYRGRSAVAVSVL